MKQELQSIVIEKLQMESWYKREHKSRLIVDVSGPTDSLRVLFDNLKDSVQRYNYNSRKEIINEAKSNTT